MKKNMTEIKHKRKVLSDNINWYIKKIKTNKTNFAEKINIQYSFFNELINQEKDPTPMMIDKLCQEMKISEKELYLNNLPEIYDNTLLRTFGENFRRIVKARNISLKKISDDTEIPQSTVSQWNNSVMLPRPNYFDILSDYFKIPVSTLFCEANESGKDYQLIYIINKIPKGKETDVVKFASLLLEQMIV